MEHPKILPFQCPLCPPHGPPRVLIVTLGCLGAADLGSRGEVTADTQPHSLTLEKSRTFLHGFFETAARSKVLLLLNKGAAIPKALSDLKYQIS
jgi:hypothetical protein